MGQGVVSLIDFVRMTYSELTFVLRLVYDAIESKFNFSVMRSPVIARFDFRH